MIKNNFTTFSDKLVDLRTDVRLLDVNNTTYYSDGVHYTALGNEIVASLVYDKIKEF